mgnify:CR=1 FL=1
MGSRKPGTDVGERTRERNCRGDALPFTNPGIRELRRYGYEDVAESVRCDFITGWKSHP